MQYTIRGIPAVVDHALRERARAAGQSLNEVVVDASAEGAGTPVLANTSYMDSSRMSARK